MHTQNIHDLIIIRYRRKSTDDEDRQVASLADQDTELDTLTVHLKITPSQLIDNIAEAKTAKVAGRPEFNVRVIKSISEGKANAIQVWHPDRISRNIVDTAAVINLMDAGKLLAVITPQQIFWNTPMDKFFLALMCMQAKLENDNRGENVKRGLSGKIRKGWRPGAAPIGYLNNETKERGERDIVIDEERFPRVRKLWDLALTGRYSLRQLREITNNELMLRTLKRKKLGGKPLTVSHIHSILTDPFYYGWYWWKNPHTGVRELHEGKHKKMITEEEYRTVRLVLGRPTRPQPKTHLFTYTGLIHCGECPRSMVTAEEKWQVICGECKHKFASEYQDRCPRCNGKINKMPNKKVLHYVYYHCGKQTNPACSQKSVRVEDLEAQIDGILAGFNIKQKYMLWALRMLKTQKRDGQETDAENHRHVQRQRAKLIEQLSELNRFIIRQDNDGWPLMRKEDALAERMHLEADLESIGGPKSSNSEQQREWLESAGEAFDYACHARFWLKEGTREQKRAIVEALGSNLILKNKKLSVCLQYPLPEIKKMLVTAPELNQSFELPKAPGNTGDFGRFRPNCSSLRWRLNAIRKTMSTTNIQFHGPSFLRELRTHHGQRKQEIRHPLR